MTTEIGSIHGGGVGLVLNAWGGKVFAFLPYATATCKDVGVHRADFLAAVETECGVRVVPADAIVIDRAEVPPVTPSGGCSGAGTQYLSAAGHEIESTADAALVRVHALALLALAEYLDAHPPTPPVDEADVEALAGLILDPAKPYEYVVDPAILARSLLATGRVSVTP